MLVSAVDRVALNERGSKRDVGVNDNDYFLQIFGVP